MIPRVLVILLATLPLLAANGTGFWITSSFSQIGPQSSEMDKSAENLVFTLVDNTLGNDSIDFTIGDNTISLRSCFAPTVTAGYEKSVKNHH